MSPNCDVETTSNHGIPILPAGDVCRYLGVQVGSRDTHDANWKGCVKALTARLALAVSKTHSVTQRTQIAQAIIVPKILYIARHEWPTEDVVGDLHRFIKKFVWGTRDVRSKKAWLSEEQAELGMKNGGLALPNIRTELMTMSATTVAKWARACTDFEGTTSSILLTDGSHDEIYITPAEQSCRIPGAIGSSLWSTGQRILEKAFAHNYTATEVQQVKKCAEALTRGYSGAEWIDGKLQVDVSDLIGTEVRDLMAARLRTRDAFCAEWLGRCSTTADGWLIDRKGTKYDLSKARIAIGTSELRHIVQWTWIQRGRVRFDYVPGYHSATAPSLRAFQRLCFALLYNFPQLLYRPKSPTLLTQYNNEIARYHEWHLTSTGDTHHYDATTLIATHTARTSDEWDACASKDVSMAEKVQFMAHPASSHIIAGDAQCGQYKGAHLGPRLRSGLNNLWKLIQAGSRERAAQNEAAMVRMIGALLIDNQCEIVERCPISMALYILFFDGGSRGNPGPGGSGSVILRINPALRQASVVWVVSMAYSHPSTTNNVAEYWDLINGLQYAQARNCVPLRVVGGSAMIIKQQQSHHPPKNVKLVKLYHRSKRLADTMCIRSWKHHHRAHNRMADLAANHAMNTKSSAQYAFPTTRSTGSEIEQLVSKDVTHWFDRFGDGTSWLGATDFDLLTNIRMYLQSDHLDRQT